MQVVAKTHHNKIVFVSCRYISYGVYWDEDHFSLIPESAVYGNSQGTFRTYESRRQPNLVIVSAPGELQYYIAGQSCNDTTGMG
jgi:hypothetical protein